MTQEKTSKETNFLGTNQNIITLRVTPLLSAPVGLVLSPGAIFHPPSLSPRSLFPTGGGGGVDGTMSPDRKKIRLHKTVAGPGGKVLYRSHVPAEIIRSGAPRRNERR